MRTDLQALLDLQDKDKAVMAVRDDLVALEPETKALDDEVAAAETEFETAKRRVEEADGRRAELEGKIEGYRMMQERRRQRLEWVKGAKEASTLMAELDLARSVLAKEEAEWIRSADKVQEAEHSAAEAEKRMDELKTAQAPKREELAARREEYDERLGKANVARAEAAKNVPADLLERYERIMRGKARLALYPLVNGACGQCFTAIPLNRRQKLLNGQGIEHCEGCGVLVFDVGE